MTNRLLRLDIQPESSGSSSAFISDKNRSAVMKRKLSALLVAGALASIAAAPGVANAQISDDVIKIGVLNDMSGLYADLGGMGSVHAAQMAVDDFGAAIWAVYDLRQLWRSVGLPGTGLCSVK